MCPAPPTCGSRHCTRSPDQGTVATSVPLVIGLGVQWEPGAIGRPDPDLSALLQVLRRLCGQIHHLHHQILLFTVYISHPVQHESGLAVLDQIDVQPHRCVHDRPLTICKVLRFQLPDPVARADGQPVKKGQPAPIGPVLEFSVVSVRVGIGLVNCCHLSFFITIVTSSARSET